MGSWLSFVEHWRAIKPNKEAFFGEQPCSYEAFYELCLKAQSKLGSLGLKAQSRILTVTKRTYRYFVIFAGCVLNGFIFVPLEETIKNDGRLLEKYKGDYLIDDIDEFCASLEDMAAPKANNVEEDAISQVIFTSGTTGTPKEVASNNRFLLNLSGKFDGFSENTRMLCLLPLNHYGGLHATLSAIKEGGCVTYVQGLMDFDGFFNAFEIHKANALFATPSMLRMLLKIGKDELKTLPLEKLYLVGEPCPKTLKDELAEVFKNAEIYNLYGSSECGLVSYGPIEENGCLGKIAEGKEAIIIDSIIHVKTSYGADKCDKMIDKIKTYSMNDRGFMKDGKLYFLGREGKTINSGGMKIDPSEIESTLMELAGVQACVCVGVPDDLLGQQCVLYYVGGLSEEEIKLYLRRKLEEYKIPHKIIATKELKQNQNGKIDRKFYEERKI